MIDMSCIMIQHILKQITIFADIMHNACKGGLFPT